jgi:small ligand-binding sensory domain FIST
VKVGAAISAEHDPLAAGEEAAHLARTQLNGASADLALVFASGEHLAAPEAMLEGVIGVLSPEALIGCAAGGVLASGRKL